MPARGVSPACSRLLLTGLVAIVGSIVPAYAAQPLPSGAMQMLPSDVSERESLRREAQALQLIDEAEAKLWEPLMAAFASRLEFKLDLGEAQRLRRGILPWLNGRQSIYLQREIDAERALQAGDSGRHESDAALLRGRTEVAALQIWSEQVALAQISARAQLEGVHLRLLGQAQKSGMVLDASRIEELIRIRAQRDASQARYDRAAQTWAKRQGALETQHSMQENETARRLVVRAEEINQLAGALRVGVQSDTSVEAYQRAQILTALLQRVAASTSTAQRLVEQRLGEDADGHTSYLFVEQTYTPPA